MVSFIVDSRYGTACHLLSIATCSQLPLALASGSGIRMSIGFSQTHLKFDLSLPLRVLESLKTSPFHKAFKFIFKTFRPMMFFLVGDIFSDTWNICFADGNREILVLPTELVLHRPLLFIQNDDSPLMSCIIFSMVWSVPSETKQWTWST